MGRLRTLAGAAVAGATATLTANRWLRERAGPLGPGVDATWHTDRWRGFEIEYAEAGDPDDPDALLLHGLHAAASTREFRGIVDRLAETHHVVAPDLPGFGRSDRPPVTYTAALYEAFVAEFGDRHTDGATCIATSLSGAYAAGAADDAGFERLVLVCPTDRTGGSHPTARHLLRSPVVGEGLFNLLVSRPSLAYFDRREGYERWIPPGTVDYQWQTTHQPGARFAPAGFVAGDLDPAPDLGDTLAALDATVTLVWGREATRPPLYVGRALAQRVNCDLLVVDDARLLPHDEHPDAVLDALDLPGFEGE